MKTNQKRQGLLNKYSNHYQLQRNKKQWIEMADMQYREDTATNYIKLAQEDIQRRNVVTRNPYQKYVDDKNIKKHIAAKPIAPTSSYAPQPNKIVMNGKTFLHKDAIQGMKRQQLKPKKPQMQVQCPKCFEHQMVPANTHAFICYNCRQTQACTPQYGIFICGNCESKVWYKYGMSNMIKCTKCWTVNNIPMQVPAKRQINPYNTVGQEQISFQELKSETESLNLQQFHQKYPNL